MNVKKRILPIFMALTLFALVVLVPVSAAPPAGGETTYKVSEFTANNVGSGAQTISGVPNLFSWTKGNSSVSSFILEDYAGIQVMRDGTDNKTSSARETVIEPLAYADGELSYPVTGISGKRTLTSTTVTNTSAHAITKSASTFFTHKKVEVIDGGTVETYYGPAIGMSAGTGVGLALYRPSTASGYMTMTLTKDAVGNVTKTEYAGGASSNPTFYNNSTSGTKLQDFLVAVDGEAATAAMKETAKDDFSKKVTLEAGEDWVDYNLYWGTNGKAVLELTLNLQMESGNHSYTFRFELVNHPTDTDYQNTLGLGGRFSGNNVGYRFPNYYADFTVKYDTSAYQAGNPGELDDDIAALAPYTLKNNPDLLADLEALEVQYNALTPAQQAGIANGATLKNAIAALRAGKYFYDPLDTADNWRQDGTNGGYSYFETNDMLPEGGQMVSVSGQMFVGSPTGSVEGVTFAHVKDIQYYWIGIDNRDSFSGDSAPAGRLYTGGRNDKTTDTTNNANRKPVDANFIEGSFEDTRFKKNTWVDFSYEYDFGRGCYVYTASGVDKNDQAIKIVYACATAPANVTYNPASIVDNARIVCRTDNFTQNFRNISVSILDSNYVEALIYALPDPADIGVEHEDEITLVKQIMNDRLPQEERDKISGTAKTRLENITAALQAAVDARDNNLDSNAMITFEDGEPGREYLEAVRANTPIGWGIVDNPFPGAGNTSAKVLEITQNYAQPSGDTTANYAIYKLKNAVVPGTKLLSDFSGKVYTAGSGVMVVYDYKGPDDWSGFRIYRNAGGNICFRDINKPGARKDIPTHYETPFALENVGGASVPDPVWAEFNVEYTLLSCTISVRFYSGDNTYLGSYDRTSTLRDTCETQIGFAVPASSANTKGYVDDISVKFQSGQAYTDAQNFMEAHSYILNLIPAETYLSYNDFGYVDAVDNAYAALSADAKRYIPFAGSKIANLKAARAAVQADPDFETLKARDLARLAAKNAVSGDYSDYTLTENFENGDLSLFQPAKQAINTGSVAIVDSDIFGSKALRMDGRSVLTMKELLMPDRPQAAKVEYKIYMDIMTENTNKKGLMICHNYQHAYRFNGTNFIQCVNSALKPPVNHLTARYVGYTPPMTTTYYTNTELVLGTIWNVSLTYNAGGKCSMQITDGNGATLSLSQTANLFSLFTLSSNDMPVYIDDVSVTYRKGNYDVDTESTDINVNYTANTWVKPGDVALVSGEGLKNNVARAEILPLPNNAAAGKGYIDRTWFDYDGVHKDEFSAAPSAPYWDSGAAQAVDIVQWTDNSLKFVVPTTLKDGTTPFPDGIYAVRLYSSRDGSYEIIYINSPSIDYSVGTDGGVTVPGGTMRVIGKNFAHDLDASKLRVVMVRSGTERPLNVSAVQSNYSISVDIPADTAYGEYELWIYGGYGDGTAWAIPAKFTVGKAVRDGWNKTVFNIRDYGAIGVSSQNATPFFINALAAIAENGGGILYLPDGQYDLNTSLIIPENCVITGDGPDKTTINFRPYAHAVNKLPVALFRFTKNVEISNLAIKGSRVSGVLRGYGSASDNLYFENLYVAIQPYAGTVTEGTGGLYRGLVSSAELYGMVSMESVNPVISLQAKGSNVQIRNVDASRTFGRNRPVVNDFNGSYYWQVDNLKVTGGWSEVIVSKSLWENSEHGPNACTAAWGHGVYFANNKFFDRTDNNRELYVADRNADYRGQITPVSDDPDNVLFYTLKTPSPSNYRDKDMQLYIANGQGVGQVRQIVSHVSVKVGGQTMYRLTVDRPFTVAPNRNSTAIIRRPRENIFFVNNEYSNGTAGGFYGGCADVVYDGNIWTNCTGIYQMGIFSDVNWYLSIVGDTVNEGPNGKGGFTWRAQSGKNAQVAFLMRGCRISGQHNTVTPGGTDSLIDCIIDNNTWSGSNYAILFDAYTTAGRYEGVDGFLLARNMLENTPHMFDPGSSAVPQAAMTTTNSAASKRLVMLDIPESTDGLLMGDVNRDGKVSLKDATLILYYVVGQVELSDVQKIVADVNGDGNVNTRDATMIHMYIVGSISRFAAPAP